MFIQDCSHAIGVDGDERLATIIESLLEVGGNNPVVFAMVIKAQLALLGEEMELFKGRIIKPN
jgi:hypothetical protein